MADDETEKTIRIERPQRADSPLEQIRQLSQQVAQTSDALRGQRAYLRQFGMSLPFGALETVQTARQQLEALMTHVALTQGELRQLRGLADTTALINSSLDTTDVLNQVIDRVVGLTGAERGYIALRNADTGALEFRIARGMDQAQLATDSILIVSSTIVERVVSTGEPVLTHNALSDPRYAEQQSVVGFGLRSILAVPLMVQDQVIGVVYCDNRIRTGLFKEHEMTLLKAFANQAAVAIENARLFEAIRAQLAEMTEIRDLMDNIFTSIVSGLVTLDADNRITAYNPAAARIVGVTEAQALGQPFESIFSMLDGDFARSLQAVRALDRSEQMELDISFDNPDRRYWKVKINPLRGEGGQSGGLALVLDDLTEVRQREAQLSDAASYMPVSIESLRRLDLIGDQGGQERIVSVVSADVRGFTAFSEQLEPEALMQIINEYLSRASDAIELYDGVVDKYMGDAVTGLFNTQLNAQTDHAVRAVRAGLSMTYDVMELHKQLPEDQQLFYGVGVHTGAAVLGSVGSAERREFSAIGDAVDLSKLLQENAGRGEIMISEATYALVSDLFICEPLPPRKTRGRDDFTVMYQVSGIKRRTGILPSIDADELPAT